MILSIFYLNPSPFSYKENFNKLSLAPICVVTIMWQERAGLPAEPRRPPVGRTVRGEVKKRLFVQVVFNPLR